MIYSHPIIFVLLLSPTPRWHYQVPRTPRQFPSGSCLDSKLFSLVSLHNISPESCFPQKWCINGSWWFNSINTVAFYLMPVYKDKTHGKSLGTIRCHKEVFLMHGSHHQYQYYFLEAYFLSVCTTSWLNALWYLSSVYIDQTCRNSSSHQQNWSNQ